MIKLNDVIADLKALNIKSRKRDLVDKRSYLIGLLYYRFKLTEQNIAALTGVNRNTVQHNKNHAINFMNNSEYVENIKELREKYFYVFPKKDERKKEYNFLTTQVRFSEHQRVLLRKTQEKLKHTDVTVTIRYLIRKALKDKIWEK